MDVDVTVLKICTPFKIGGRPGWRWCQGGCVW